MISTKKCQCPTCGKVLLSILRFGHWYVDCPVCYEEVEVFKEVDAYDRYYDSLLKASGTVFCNGFGEGQLTYGVLSLS